MTPSFALEIKDEIDAEKSRLELIASDTVPIEVIGDSDNDVAVGILIAVSVTLVLAFIMAGICYCVRECDERARKAEVEQKKDE